MSNQVIALAAEFAALPGIGEMLRGIGEPTTLTVALVALAGVAIGKAITHGRPAGRD